ncbi:hypothetical protein [Desulfosediminicola flagellatus]|uniref:hypothetical protein n=1 Tax=Desulfosediminicola flagellatus TaxID=2569541 RepID=UPI0010ACD9DF|nr:hypothetical protein [Desulfosediminicola flagellatus]
MKKHVTLFVSLLLLITCAIEVGLNIETLLKQEADSVLYIERSRGEATSTTREGLLDFDYSLENLPNAGS